MVCTKWHVGLVAPSQVREYTREYTRFFRLASGFVVLVWGPIPHHLYVCPNFSQTINIKRILVKTWIPIMVSNNL